MADLKLIGAVAIKVRPDATAFKRETQADVNKQLGPDGDRVDAKVKVKVAADTTKAKVEIKRLEDEVNGKKLNLNVGMDYDGVKRAREQIDQALRSLDNKVIKVTMDKDGLLEAKRKLNELSQDAKVDFKFVRDEAGYKSILAKIRRIREEKGMTSTWKFKTDTASLAEAERKAKEALARIEAKKTITINYSKDYDGIQQAIGEIDKRLDKLRELKLKTKLDRASLEAAKAGLVTKLETAPVTVKFNEDKAGYDTVLKRIADIRRQRAEVSIKFNTDEASLVKAERQMRDGLLGSAEVKIEIERQSKLHAEREAKDLKKKIEDMKASMKIEIAGSALTAARLQFLGRDRVVNYIARVNTASIAAVEGVLKSLGGINTLSSLGKMIEGMFTKFDTFSLKVAGLATALGSLASVGVYAGTAIFRVGEGAVQSLGLLAAAPAILLAATAGYTIFTAAFNNFFDAFNKDPKIAKSALEALPPVARKTVESITGLYKGLANPIQEKFWSRVGSTLSDAVTKLYPDLKKGLLNSTVAIGDFVAGFGRSMTKLSLTHDIDKLFGNLNGFFVNLSKASEPFFDGFNKFGVKGSELLPRFGQWIADAATRFDKWATTASANGSILDWIEHGANSMKNIWQVGGSVIDIFKGITRAAGLAGTGGLAAFNLHMREIADNMMSEPWQSRAANIFEGARAGASKLNAGLGDLSTTLGNSSQWLGTVLTQLGNIGGLSLTNLAVLFSNKTYQSGISAELQGLETLVGDLAPAFHDLGTIIGNMGKVAGSVFANLAPVISSVTTLLAGVTTTLADNLAAVAPKMSATVGAIFGAVAPLATGLADTLNGILGIAKLVPNSFVVMGAAAAAYFALRGLSSKFYDSLKGTSTFKSLEGNWLRQQSLAGKTQTSYRLVNGEMQKFTVPTGKFSALKQGYQEMTGKVDGMRATFRNLNDALLTSKGTLTFGDQLKNLGKASAPAAKAALGGLMDVLGGPWGIALAGAGIAIGMFAQQQADAKAHVDELNRSLDKQTGQFDASGLESIAKSWSDIGKAGDGWANFTRGAKAANETASALKLNLADVTKTIAEGGPKSDKLVGDLTALGSAMSDLEHADPGVAGRSMDILKQHVDEAGKSFGLTADQLSQMGIHAADIEHLTNNIKDEANKAALAKAVFEGLAKATGTTSIAAEQMAGAMKTIGDNSIDAAGKIGAINKALDLLHGGKQSAREAEVAAQSQFQKSIDQATQLHDALANNNHLIDGTTGLIDVTSTSGLQLQQTMADSANAIKTNAQAAYDAAVQAGKTPVQAMADAQQVVTDGNRQLDAIAKAAGIAPKALQKEWEGLFGKQWELSATFSATADKFQAVRDAVQESGQKWDDSTFSAFLKANPDIANLTIDQARQRAIDFANAKYQAQLQAINPAALAKILEATGQANNYKNGDYIAVMKALNSTAPGVQAAWNALMGVKGGPAGAGWAAAFKAYLDAVSAANTEAQLAALAANRKVYIEAVLSRATASDLNGPASGNGRPGLFNGGYFPGGVRNAADLFRGQFPAGLIKAFANGGIEQHVAQIAKPSSTYRVWAEPETGGEAYIPLAASKRSRSTAILNQVASQFGYQLTKQAFADGGVVGAGGRNRQGGNVAVNIDSYIQQSNNTADDVARAIMRRVKSRGVYTPMEGF